MTTTFSAPPQQLKPLQTSYRLNSIDLLRGLVMVIMALDHVRDFFHSEAFTDDPMNLATTTPWLYFTRWITHLCAPTFVFLSGTSAFLMGQKKTKAQLSKFLITRGLWLVFVELFIITLGWTFNPLYNLFILQVIWAIGISMIILGVLVLFPYWIVLAFGLAVLLGHNLLDYPEAARNGNVGTFWEFLHHGFFRYFPLDNDHGVMLIYAFLPWSGLMALGYCLGVLFTKDVSPELRKKRLVRIGLGLIALFIVLRLINKYGDPHPWSSQPRGALYTFFSFMNVNKYPPSLMFACATLGPMILLLAFLEKVKSAIGDFFIVYGRVPFFYYVLHFYFIHAFCLVAFFASGYSWDQRFDPNSPFLFRPQHFGFGLPVVYVVWITVVLLLYPLCKWYGNYKLRHKEKWILSYL